MDGLSSKVDFEDSRKVYLVFAFVLLCCASFSGNVYLGVPSSPGVFGLLSVEWPWLVKQQVVFSVSVSPSEHLDFGFGLSLSFSMADP